MLWLAYVMADLCYAERSFLTCVVLSPQVFEQNRYFFGFTKIVFFRPDITNTPSRPHKMRRQTAFFAMSFRVDKASAVRQLSQKNRKANIWAPAVF